MHYMTFEKGQDIIAYDEHAEHKKFVEKKESPLYRGLFKRF